MVIAIPNSSRAIPLLKQLSISEKFDVTVFPAIMFNGQTSVVKPNYHRQQVLYQRKLSDGEIGCAMSHFEVQKFLSSQDRPCVILEDDARIHNIHEFEGVVISFLQQAKESNSILNLLPWKTHQKAANSVSQLRFIKLVGKPRLSTGYVATVSALESLYLANKDFAYLPDWPPTKTRFFTTLNGVIVHGDSDTYSMIDLAGRYKTMRIKKLIKFTLIYYTINQKYFTSFKEYLSNTFLLSLTWRIDKIRLYVAKYYK